MISEIVTVQDIQVRAKTIESIIMTAHVHTFIYLSKQYLEKINNFNGLKVAMTVLQSGVVTRLRKTEAVSLWYLEFYLFS